MKFGFPLDFDRNTGITSQKINHKSVLDYPDHVQTYLQEEMDHKAILGPYKDSPSKIFTLVPS